MPNSNGGSAGQTWRSQLTGLSGGAQGQARVTFTNAAGATFDTTHCSIGVDDGSGTGSTTALPVELTFGGASGFSIPGTSSLVSDWVNFSGFTSGNNLIVIADVDAAGSGVISFNSSEIAFEKAATQSWNTQTVSGYSTFGGPIGVTLVETRSNATAKLFRPGNLDGLGGGGPFFSNPLSAPAMAPRMTGWRKPNHLWLPERLAA